MPEKVGVDPLDRRVQVPARVGHEAAHPVRQRIERVVQRAARLDHPVRAQHQHIPRPHRHPPRLGAAGDEVGEAERDPRLCGVERVHRAVRADQQRRDMAVVQQFDAVGPVELREERGDEVAGGDVPPDADVHPPGDRVEPALVERGLAEGAEHHRRGLHRGEALAAYVPDEGPYAVRGVQHRVEVAADQRGVGGGDVAHGKPDVADPRVGRAHQGVLGGLGDRGDRAEGLGAGLPPPGDVDAEKGDQAVGEGLPEEDVVVGDIGDAVVGGEAGLDQQAEHPDEERLAPGDGDRGQRRCHHDARCEEVVPARDEVRADDYGDGRQRQRQAHARQILALHPLERSGQPDNLHMVNLSARTRAVSRPAG